jgi:hypothetical protein
MVAQGRPVEAERESRARLLLALLERRPRTPAELQGVGFSWPELRQAVKDLEAAGVTVRRRAHTKDG